MSKARSVTYEGRKSRNQPAMAQGGFVAEKGKGSQLERKFSDDAVADDWIAVKMQPFVSDKERSLDVTDRAVVGTSMSYGFSVGPGEVASQLVIALSEYHGGESDVVRHWQESCSFSKLEDRHSIIASLFPSLSSLLPPLPREPSGLWSYFLPYRVPDGTYGLIRNYLDAVLSTCGISLMVDVFFDTEGNVEQYVQDMSELNHDRLEQDVAKAKEGHEEIMRMRETCVSLEDMVIWYGFEDEAVKKLEHADLKLYEFMRRPYVDLKEIAQCERQRSLQLSLDDNLPVAARVRAEADEEEAQADISVASSELLELREQRYSTVIHRIAARIQRMLADRDRFCPQDSSKEGQWISSGACTIMRLLERKMVDATVDFLQVRCRQLQIEKDAVLLRITLLEVTDRLRQDVEENLREFYRIHQQLLEVKINLLDEREKQVRYWIEDVPPEDAEERERLGRREGKIGAAKSRYRIELVSLLSLYVACF